MRQPGSPAESGRKALSTLIIINTVIWIWTMLNPRGALEQIGILSAPAIRDMQLWRIASYMFLHADFFHLLFNMWGLYIFGQSVAEELGRARFLALYFISGIFGGLLWTAANWNTVLMIRGFAVAPQVVGASGAVFGVMMAMAMLNPNREYMIIFFPMPLKCKTLICVYAIIEVVSQLGGGGRIAHLAHLGGFIAAYLFIKLYCPRLILWDPLRLRSSKIPWQSSAPPPPPRGWTVHDNKNQTSAEAQEVSPREVDRLLDKISAQGINSLTSDELLILRRAREQMRRH